MAMGSCLIEPKCYVCYAMQLLYTCDITACIYMYFERHYLIRVEVSGTHPYTFFFRQLTRRTELDFCLEFEFSYVGFAMFRISLCSDLAVSFLSSSRLVVVYADLLLF